MSSTTPSTPASSTIEGWRVILRIAGALITLAAATWWYAAGANTGWTKDRVATIKTDEITGIEYPEYEKRFVPGINLLVAGCALGLGVIGATFFSRKKPTHTS